MATTVVNRSYWLLAALLGLLFPAALVAHGTSLWMPASGVAFAVLVLYGPRMIPLLVGTTAVSVIVSGQSGMPVLVVVTAASANTTALALWAWGLRASGVDLRMRRLQDAAVVAVAGAAATVASTGLIIVVLAAWRPVSFWTLAEHTLLTNGAGLFAVAPLLLLTAVRGIRRNQLPELAVLAALFVAAAQLSAGGYLAPPLYYPLLIPMVWAALRLGVAGTVTGAAVGTLALAVIEHRYGLPADQTVRLEIFMTVFSVAGLCFGAAQSERQDAQRELEDSRAALAESEERLRLLIEASAIFMVDPDGNVLTWNSGAAAMHGYRADEIIGRSVSVLGAGADEELLQAARGGRSSTEAWRLRKDGTRYWANVLVTALRDDGGRLQGYSEVVLDLTERRATEQRLKRLATSDPLTGLANRAYLHDRLERALAHGPVGVLFLDLDGFKEINDGWGHDAGDRVLGVIAARLRSVIRPSDLAARVGGDEFVLLCRHLSRPADLAAIADRVGKAVQAPIPVGKGTVSVGASIGVAEGQPGQRAAEVIKEADRAMYALKRARPRRPRRLELIK
ncbi:MAG: diguanylate cyclase [Acidimicrobiales bacterium]|nr:diguanylate cyclase [Acidimicrobiales bacterium]